MGNKDYTNRWTEAEFIFRKNGWRIDDFFWSHAINVDDQKLAFVHIDTSFLAYGVNGEPGNPFMKSCFQKYSWAKNKILDIIEKLLQDNKEATYKIAIGHHPIGHMCGNKGNLYLIEPLLWKYGF